MDEMIEYYSIIFYQDPLGWGRDTPFSELHRRNRSEAARAEADCGPIDKAPRSISIRSWNGGQLEHGPPVYRSRR